jgi:hypothetical protein
LSSFLNSHLRNSKLRSLFLEIEILSNFQTFSRHCFSKALETVWGQGTQ